MNHLEFNIGWLSINNIDKCGEYKLKVNDTLKFNFSFNQKTECFSGASYGRGGG